MIVFPAIDIIDGQCVRLTRGDFDQKKKYSNDPIKVAQKWKEYGAEWIHIIDLDGARTGKISNLSIAARIRDKLEVKVQYGGGIRDQGSIEKVLSEGIDRAILGTRAIEDNDFLESCFNEYDRRIILSLDYGKNGTIYKNGWQKRSSKNIFDFLKKLETMKMKEIIVTDIDRDGTLGGINMDFLKKILLSTGISFIIAGGIGNIKDIEKLKELEEHGISGVIAGKALYEGDAPMDLGEAIRTGKGN
ncbi:MAG TPA: 1-(5-phosphoribosyl)-5-[(5-phosphoribosylamino)methylideneamino]imidazole-4-carboxamide isomerase [Actinobacteria bacterium]|nr:1-(5-phosphoribosyl)-5-[(5-phosphoribosylamino)methylideneamino]imidazole-4-carboxamide isomerase [Actinomycetota bacterium]